MPECDYCEEAFDGEDAYLDHLVAAHEGELGRIDQRRVADHAGEDGDGLEFGPVVLVGLLVAVGALVVWVTFGMGGGAASGGEGAGFEDGVQQPSGSGSVHYHGPITVVIGGDELDFSRDRFQLRSTGDRAFHFEGGNGDRYHVHAQGVTLEYALESLGIGVRQDLLAFDGTVYNESRGATVVYEVNGESVEPETYVLQRDDSVRVVANNSN
jgi:sulfur carrier protein ThiS